MIKFGDVLAAHGDATICKSAQEAIEFVGRRWVGVLLIAGHLGARRFTDYRRYASGISDRVLTQRLRELERYGLLERTVVASMPVQIRYAPTTRGEALVRALQPLTEWSLESPADDLDHHPAGEPAVPSSGG